MTWQSVLVQQAFFCCLSGRIVQSLVMKLKRFSLSPFHFFVAVRFDICVESISFLPSFITSPADDLWRCQSHPSRARGTPSI